jgi:putative oxidoreductase
MTIRILHWTSCIILAVIFLYSGYIKIESWLQFAAAVTGYQLVPENLVIPIARYFPWVEIALGVLLLSGWKSRYTGMASAGLLLFFTVILTITYFRGINANCGCFSFDDRISPKTIARDSLFLIPALFLIFENKFPRKPKNSDPASIGAAPDTE